MGRSADAEPKADADASYGVHGYPYAYGAYYGKRSADAEPEADAYYGYYGYARPYAYGYRSYGYPAYGYYGKRSADAEPEADADAFYGVYGYSAYRPYAYSAYRPYAFTTRWGYGKRSADAEAEADPALVYTSAVPAVHSVVSSPLVSALTPAATLKTVHTPVTYTHAVAAPAVTYAGVHAVHTRLSTQLDPQSTMERERPRLIQLSSTPTLSQLSTLLSEP